MRLAGLRGLRMVRCRGVARVFAHLRGIPTLDMSWCSQTAITKRRSFTLRRFTSRAATRPTTIRDAAFAPLAGIRMLNVYGCDQPAISGATRAWAAALLRGSLLWGS